MRPGDDRLVDLRAQVMLKYVRSSSKWKTRRGKSRCKMGGGDGAGLRHAQGCNAPSGILSHNGVCGRRTLTFHYHDAVEHVESLDFLEEW